MIEKVEWTLPCNEIDKTGNILIGPMNVDVLIICSISFFNFLLFEALSHNCAFTFDNLKEN